MKNKLEIIRELKSAMEYDLLHHDTRLTFCACRDNFDEIIGALAELHPIDVAMDVWNKKKPSNEIALAIIDSVDILDE